MPDVMELLKHTIRRGSRRIQMQWKSLVWIDTSRLHINPSTPRNLRIQDYATIKRASAILLQEWSPNTIWFTLTSCHLLDCRRTRDVFPQQTLKHNNAGRRRTISLPGHPLTGRSALPPSLLPTILSRSRHLQIYQITSLFQILKKQIYE